MGVFAALVVCVLKESGSEVLSETEIVAFAEPTFVSWQAGNLSESEWIATGAKSIYFRKGGLRWRGFQYEQKVCTPIEEGSLRRRSGFKFDAQFDLMATRTALHVVLPPRTVPDIRSFEPNRPQYVRRVSDKVAITWTFTDLVPPRASFVFREVSDAAFRKFRPVGEPIRMRTSVAFRKWARDLATQVKDEGKDLAAKAIAELGKQ